MSDATSPPPSIPPSIPVAALRQCVFAVAVLYDLDLEPGADGVTLVGRVPVTVSWPEVEAALGWHAPHSSRGQQQVAELVGLRRLARAGPPELVQAAVTVLGWPADAPDHPGPEWPLLRVAGGALHLGPAVIGLGGLPLSRRPPDSDGHVAAPASAAPVSAEALEAAGVPLQQRWLELLAELEVAGELAATRICRRARAASLTDTGRFDVVTLLGSRTLREALAREAGGMAPLVVPMRNRGWVASSALDPAFGPAAFFITDPLNRGFARPLLVTADEVQQVAEGGQAARHLFDRGPAR